MPAPFVSFYRGKRVLVTGHTGFTGGWLVAWLKLLGAKICGYGLPPATRPNLFDATLLDRGIASIFGDIRNGEALTNAFADFQPEIVIHCAAQSWPTAVSSGPADIFATNVMGTVNVLEECRLSQSARALVLASSDSCYAARDSFQEYCEGDALGGRDPYGASIAAAELAAATYIDAFFRNTKTAVATARIGNLIGGGDWSDDRLVPGLVSAIISEKPAQLIDDGGAASYWHALEAARAYLLLAQQLFESGQIFSGSWNFGPVDEDTVSTKELAENLIKLWGAGQFSSQPAGDPAPPLRLNTDKARSLLEWAPALPLNESLEWTVEWYKAFYADPSSAWRISESQIERYAKMTSR